MRYIIRVFCALFATTAIGWSAFAEADAAVSRHGYSVFGDLKYSADFEHFTYTNPEAPKGGDLKISYMGTFDTLNHFVVKGTGAYGLQSTYDRLMQYAHDELGANYGLVAESVKTAPDHSWIEFTVRSEARWHDGKPITVEDVIFSMETFRDHATPIRRGYLAEVKSAEKIDDRTVRFNFSSPGQRKLCYTLGAMTVLPKHYWKGRDFQETTLEPPLTSGPYKIKTVDQGRSITYERVKDYWARDLPVQRGQHNFDTVTYEYYRDVNARFEAFKAGQVNYRLELSAALWAKGYNFEAMRNGDMIKNPARTEDPATILAWGFNLRREKFQDVRVRKAFNLAFDFEWFNKNFYFGNYARSDSYFANSTLGATGLPSPGEIKLLEPWRESLPPEVFTEEFKGPMTDGTGNNRKYLVEAAKLLREAGWIVEGGVLKNSVTGEPFKAEFLVNNTLMERAAGPYLASLKKLGIQAEVRRVDSTQLFSRLQVFDFDVTVIFLGQNSLPTRGLRSYWGSETAKAPGSYNFGGISNPAVDAMLETIATTNSQEEYFAAIKAVDRILLWNYYAVPLYHAPQIWRAHAKELKSKPWTGPMYDAAFPASWWYEAEE